jgi:hypothetical protein
MDFGERACEMLQREGRLQASLAMHRIEAEHRRHMLTHRRIGLGALDAVPLTDRGQSRKSLRVREALWRIGKAPLRSPRTCCC